MNEATNSDYHQPVMAKECLEGLHIQPDGVYVDATFGGGGHSELILQQLGAKGQLLGFDQDADAVENALDDERFIFIASNFQYLKRFLKLYGVRQVDGILADLGVSSHQLDAAERGFSYRFETTLDMRMNQQAHRTAAEVLNTYPADELQEVFSAYGEVRNARTLAQAIVNFREDRPLETVSDFMQVLESVIRGQRNRYLSQVFQALRIEVNDEMNTFKTFLAEALDVLKPGGRLVVMSYHSLEDRLVKHFLKTGNPEGEVKKDFYGKIYRPFRIITKKAVTASASEIKANPRARSAKLRIGERKEEGE